jgi:hypothetical protein
VKVFVELTHFAATAGRSALRDRVAAPEDAGATGVAVSDHVFLTRDGRPRRDGADPGCEPMTTLAAVAGLSDRLELQTVVMNTAWIHPALLLRQFSQLAVLVGGARVRSQWWEATFPLDLKRRRSCCLSIVKFSAPPLYVTVSDWTWRRNSGARGSIAPTTRVEVLSGVTTKVAPSTVSECEIRVGMRIRGISVGSGLPVFPLSNLTDSLRSKEKTTPAELTSICDATAARDLKPIHR